jgi:hypothetical protein
MWGYLVVQVPVRCGGHGSHRQRTVRDSSLSESLLSTWNLNGGTIDGEDTLIGVHDEEEETRQRRRGRETAWWVIGITSRGKCH